MKRLGLALAMGLAGTAQAMASDALQVHGFLAQGLAWSDGNNAFGNSTDGSAKYFEAGLTARWRPEPWISFAAQGVARRAGATDDGQARLDFAFVDLQPIRRVDWQAGLRWGKVKNPHGFHNETRDVVFTRPSIALPSSVYFDGQGFRGLLFSVDGTQLYSQRWQADRSTSVLINVAPDYEVSEQDDRALLGGFGNFADQGDYQMRDLIRAQLLQEWRDGRWRMALTYFDGLLDFSSNSGNFQSGYDIRVGIVSAGYRSERYALTAEYQRTWTDTLFVFDNGTTTARFGGKSVSDGGYLQGDWHIDPKWMAFIRADSRYNNAKDRDGRGSNNRYRQFAHDLVLGGRWQPDMHWGIWAEVHRIYGTASVPAQDNPGRSLDPHWTLVLLMAGYRF